MITDTLFQLFVRTLGSHKHVKRGAIGRTGLEGVPVDVGRLLTAVGGWKYVDLRFTEAEQLERDRAALTEKTAAFEAGKSQAWHAALWNPAWYPLATSSTEIHAFDPIGCFGGTPEQVVIFEIAGSDTWRVFPSLTAYLSALNEGFEALEGKDALPKAMAWARANHQFVEIKLPATIEDQRGKGRFEAGVGAWITMRHPDGRAWAVRERRDGYELRIGEGEDAVIRKRAAAKPGAEIKRLLRDQKADGFVPQA
ncbi:MAG: hypothetical protein QM831_43625 [Kofleriaceae bacterium]